MNRLSLLFLFVLFCSSVVAQNNLDLSKEEISRVQEIIELTREADSLRMAWYNSITEEYYEVRQSKKLFRSGLSNAQVHLIDQSIHLEIGDLVKYTFHLTEDGVEIYSMIIIPTGDKYFSWITEERESDIFKPLKRDHLWHLIYLMDATIRLLKIDIENQQQKLIKN